MTHPGDGGKTFNPRSGRVSKASPEVCALGELDELSCHAGLLAAMLPKSCRGMAEMLLRIQKTIFALCGAESGAVSAVEISKETIAAVADLEHWIAEFDVEIGPGTHFVIPGGHPAACQAQVCRAVCRRAERTAVALGESRSGSDTPEQPLAYLNRLSLFFFTIARVINNREKIKEERP